MGKTLFDKVWDAHLVKTLPNGQSQLFIDLHLIHEVTSPQAFGMLRSLGLQVAHPERTFATADHIIPTDNLARPFADGLADRMLQAIEQNCRDNNIKYFGIDSGDGGVVHVISPEKGLTQPGMTIACGDSHTSTHGAFGSIAFGIGTNQIRDILATQTVVMDRLQVRKIEIDGQLAPLVTAKDLILHIIRQLGVKGGIGFAYEYAGSTIRSLSMDERMTVCNMSIEGGARIGYINPDDVTFDFLKGREFAPKKQWNDAVKYWRSVASDEDAHYADVVRVNAQNIKNMVTFGINPAQSVSINEKIPDPDSMPPSEAASTKEALEYMKFTPGQPIKGAKINVAFVGSCTNGRLSDLEMVAKYIKGHKVSKHVRALIVPGSAAVKREVEKMGLHEIFSEAGFQWRGTGCSMCLAMNPDKLIGDELCASSSNRNFKGRQGSPTGRTLLMSPLMVAACAVAGEVADPHDVFTIAR